MKHIWVEVSRSGGTSMRFDSYIPSRRYQQYRSIDVRYRCARCGREITHTFHDGRVGKLPSSAWNKRFEACEVEVVKAVMNEDDE